MTSSRDEMMARAFELSRQRSESLLAESGANLAQYIEEGRIEFGIDRTVYSLLARLDPNRIRADFDVDLATAIKVTKTAALLEFSMLLVSLIGSFFVFHWWGLAVALVGFVLYQWGVSSNVTGSGGIALVCGVGGGIAALQARSLSEAIWAISWSAAFWFQWIRYQIPVRAVKRAALGSRSFMEFLVSADAAVLRRRESGTAG